MLAVREPNGIIYLEALANKTPIVGFNRFAFPEFCGHGKYGFIAENENPHDFAKLLCDALEDTQRLKRMGEEGQRFVRNRYNWNIVADKMMSEFRKVCNEDETINTGREDSI